MPPAKTRAELDALMEEAGFAPTGAGNAYAVEGSVPPAKVLETYRTHSPQHVVEFCEAIGDLPPADAIRLLAYWVCHTAQGLQRVDVALEALEHGPSN